MKATMLALVALGLFASALNLPSVEGRSRELNAFSVTSDLSPLDTYQASVDPVTGRVYVQAVSSPLIKDDEGEKVIVKLAKSLFEILTGGVKGGAKVFEKVAEERADARKEAALEAELEKAAEEAKKAAEEAAAAKEGAAGGEAATVEG